MKDLPEELDDGALIGVLAGGWGFEVEAAEYAPVGAGSYHWIVTSAEGARGFVTVDDLDRKPWLGHTRESAFDGLRRAFDTALALRDGGLGFVVAPIPTSGGETVLRIGPRHTIALFPFLDVRVEPSSSPFPHYDTAETRAAVLAMLAELHRAKPEAGSLARRVDLDVPGRHRLEAGLRDVGRPWSGGPFAEPARRALAAHAADVAELLAQADRLSAEVARRSDAWVLTHGEPHARNVLRTDDGYALVDWDTVALAPRERDLWMLAGDEGDPAALSFFRLLWDLTDLASYLEVLRSPHRESEDTAQAYDRLKVCVAGQRPKVESSSRA